VAGGRVEAPALTDDAVLGTAGAAAGSPPRFALKYAAVVDADTFRQERALGPRSLLVAAAHLGSTRLIDNVSLAPASPGEPQPVPKTSAYLVEDATAGKEGH